jgi:hypothetical protein
MSRENEEGVSRKPTNSESTNATIDSYLLDDYLQLDKVVYTLAESTDPEIIKSIIISERRLAFLKGVFEQANNINLIGEL